MQSKSFVCLQLFQFTQTKRIIVNGEILRNRNGGLPRDCLLPASCVIGSLCQKVSDNRNQNTSDKENCWPTQANWKHERRLQDFESEPTCWCCVWLRLLKVLWCRVFRREFRYYSPHHYPDIDHSNQSVVFRLVHNCTIFLCSLDVGNRWSMQRSQYKGKRSSSWVTN